MFKSYSSNFSYSSDGKKQSQQYNSNYKDNQKELRHGYKRNSNLNNQDKEEMFYKSKKEEEEFKKIYGKSKNNQDWTIKRFQDRQEFQPETQKYQQHSDMFSRFNKIYTPLPTNNRIENQYTPLPSFNNMSDYSEDKDNIQNQELESPIPIMINSFEKVSNNFIQLEDQFNDSFFQ